MPPGPVTSITDYHTIMNQALKFIEPNKLYIGCPLLAYGWELPYIEGLSTAISLKLNTSVELAKDKNSPIEFDEPSQTPFFSYTDEKNKTTVKSIVWSIDARTIDQFLQLTLKYALKGTGTWNIMYYYAPLWSVINSQFKINKLLPEI
jgi:spore germination protein